MRRQTCQNISTASFTALRCTFIRRWSAMSCDRPCTVRYMCSGGCVFLALTATLWLTSCSICCASIKQTDHINCIDFDGNMTAVERTPHLISFGAPQQPWHTRACTSKLLTLLICAVLPGGQVSQSAPPPSVCTVCAFLCLSPLLLFFFMPFPFNLHMPTWGKRPYHRVGINELLCCAQPA